MAYKIGLQWFMITILITHISVAKTIYERPGDACCRALSSLLPKKVFTRGNAEYSESQGSFYATQEGDLHPSCIFKPEAVIDVSIALKSLTAFHGPKCYFAVRGGGHTPFPGSANIDRGVTIDLQALNKVTLSEDNWTTSVGGGARWADVYKKLDPLNLTVGGGRANLVGVGGLTTGGGISFFSPRQGFVCDNVLNYEVVLANGTILNVNRQSHRDLLKALRGGSNNFGIVTRFDLDTFSQGKFWGGDIIYDDSVTPQLATAFTEFGAQEHYDEYSVFVMGHSYQSSLRQAAQSNSGQFSALADIYYTKPVVNPPIFDPLFKLQPQIFNTLKIDVHGSHTNTTYTAAQTNHRNIFLTITFKNDPFFLIDFINLWKKSATPILKVPGLIWSTLSQHLLPIVIEKTPGLGGNSLGLNAADGPQIITLIAATWDNPADDEAVESAAKSLLKQVEHEAKKRGVHHPFIYMNYAYAGQAVIEGYGPNNQRFLQRVSRKYDPHGVFQRQVPGGFKLFP